jgi:hypothetical protein
VTEPEGFLSRWARRKQEAGEAERHPAPDAPAPDRKDAAAAAAPAAEDAKPTVDLSALPPLESITAATDIRAYLAPGVPPDLARAALRRAWVADPAIRDFVGIAENQWDFNDPNGIPGFGPLDEAGRLLARMLTGGVQAAREGTTEAAKEAAEEAIASADNPQIAENPVDGSAHEVSPPPGPLPARASMDETAPTADQPLPPAPPAGARESAVASQQIEDSVSPGRTARRGHGGALPR